MIIHPYYAAEDLTRLYSAWEAQSPSTSPRRASAPQNRTSEIERAPRYRERRSFGSLQGEPLSLLPRATDARPPP